MEQEDEPTLLTNIEAQKENIMPIPGGRSARALAAAFKEDQYPDTDNPQHIAAREAFEAELKTASDLDDPLEVYVRYVKWITDTYPAGGGNLLEKTLFRGTTVFQEAAHYKNDPRYVRLWTTWIGRFSDAPRESFAFLSRKGIGSQLALYYEEFAAYLEANGRITQAAEIYETGIQKNANPSERLARKYEEFQMRVAANPPEQNGPSSPALPVVRPALGNKFPAPAAEESDPQAQRPVFGAESSGPAAAKPKKAGKMKIFSDDADAPVLPPTTAETKGWDNITSLADRKKENVTQSRPWQGETMKQEGGTVKKEKLKIFRDNSMKPPAPRPGEKPRKREHVVCLLESVYPEDDEPGKPELCFDEMRCATRGLLGIDWKAIAAEERARRERRRKLEMDRAREDEEDEMMLCNVSAVSPLKEREPIGPVSPPDSPEFVERVKTKTIALSFSPKAKVKRRKSVVQEPTMTFHSKAAADEIFGIFSQPFSMSDGFGNNNDESTQHSDGDYEDTTQVIHSEDEESEEEAEEEHEEEEEESEDEDDRKNENFDDEDDQRTDMLKGAFSDEAESTGFSAVDAKSLAKLTKSDDEDEEAEEAAEEMERITLDDEEEEGEEEEEDEDEPVTGHIMHGPPGSKHLPFMTPITERTESLPPSTMMKSKKATTTPCPKKADKEPTLIDIQSSPFQEVANAAQPPASQNQLDMEEDKENMPAVYKKPIAIAQDEELISFEPVKPTPAPASSSTANALKPKQPLGKKQEQPVVKKQQQKGPIVADAQCNPMDKALRASIWENLSPPLSTFEGFYDCSNTKSSKTDGIKKYIKAVGKEKSGSPLPAQPILTLNGDASYTVQRVLGKGAFAPVYLVENNNVDEDDDEDENQSLDAKRSLLEAIKMEEEPSAWEFFATRLAHRRLGVHRAASSVVRAHELHLYRDEAFLVLDYYSQGSILDVVNLSNTPSSALHSQSGTMDELLVMFFTVELLRTVEALHTKGIMHGDLKSDNCLLRLHPLADADWSSRYRRDGQNGWEQKGLVLIDFGRGIDMRCFRKDVAFIADWPTDSQDCPEMRELRPWTYQIDYYGVAAVVHSMLFGKYIDTAVDKSGANGGGGLGGGPAASRKEYKIVMGLKRYWQQEIWAEFFNVMLNPARFAAAEEEGGLMPCTGAVKRIREKMEIWLEGNCEKGVGLRGMLKKVEDAVKSKRR